jgi:hypothetical protein
VGGSGGGGQVPDVDETESASTEEPVDQPVAEAEPTAEAEEEPTDETEATEPTRPVTTSPAAEQAA